MYQLSSDIHKILSEDSWNTIGSGDLHTYVEILHIFTGDWRTNTVAGYGEVLSTLVRKGYLDFQIITSCIDGKKEQQRLFKTSEWLTETIEAV